MHLLIRFSSFKDCPFAFENTGITLTNKAFLVKAILMLYYVAFL